MRVIKTTYRQTKTRIQSKLTRLSPDPFFSAKSKMLCIFVSIAPLTRSNSFLGFFFLSFHFSYALFRYTFAIINCVLVEDHAYGTEKSGCFDEPMFIRNEKTAIFRSLYHISNNTKSQTIQGFVSDHHLKQSLNDLD